MSAMFVTWMTNCDGNGDTRDRRCWNLEQNSNTTTCRIHFHNTEHLQSVHRNDPESPNACLSNSPSPFHCVWPPALLQPKLRNKTSSSTWACCVTQYQILQLYVPGHFYYKTSINDLSSLFPLTLSPTAGPTPRH